MFAGTGSVGIEALSRGAQHVLFVELKRQPIAIIKENLKSTGLLEGAEVTQADAFTLLERPMINAFDYVYIAPPQYKDMWMRAMLLIDKNIGWLTEDGWVIVQIHPVEYHKLNEENSIKNLVEFDIRHYGSTLLVFYQRTKNDEEDDTTLNANK